MHRTLLVLAMVAWLAAGCGGAQSTIRVLETRVAELSRPTATPLPTATVALPATTGIPANEDADAFIAQLSQVLQDEGWSILESADGTLNAESPTGRRMRFQYSYGSAQVSRIVLFTVWSGLGEANLSCETLRAINDINDQYNLTKVSVDADGDIWLESVYPMGATLDSAGFVAYLAWYEETEGYMVSELLADYLE